jgi:hypothetical protein
MPQERDCVNSGDGQVGDNAVTVQVGFSTNDQDLAAESGHARLKLRSKYAKKRWPLEPFQIHPPRGPACSETLFMS